MMMMRRVAYLAATRLTQPLTHTIPYRSARLYATLTRSLRTPARIGLRALTAEGEEVVVEVPSLGDSISEGTIASTEKAVGDAVQADDVVMIIETDKISSDVRSTASGQITEILVGEGDVVNVGDPLFKVKAGAEGAKPAAAPAAEEKAPEPAAPAAAAPKKEQPKPASSKSAPAAAPAPVGSRTETRVAMTRMRKTIAGRLKESQNAAASLTTFNEIDMSNIISIRSQFKDAFQEKHGVKLGFMSIFVKAAAAALQEVPAVNAVIDGDEIVYRDYVDISVAVATPTGLVVPVLRNCESMSMADVEKEILNLAGKAREGRLALEDMTGGTFTISNGGVYGSLMGTPIINQPQSAILGMHGTFPRPIAVKGEAVVRPMMYIALTYDHRIIDGREAVTFLKKIKQVVEDPITLTLDL